MIDNELANLLDDCVPESESEDDYGDFVVASPAAPPAAPPAAAVLRPPQPRRPKPAASVASTASSSSWPKGKQATLASNREKFSGIRLKNRVVSAAAMEVQMRGRRMIQMPQLLRVARSRLENESMDWVTIGVLGERQKPRLDKSGKKFMTWRLVDLESHSVTVFLFKGAYEAHRTRDAGDVLALINPRVLPALEGRGGSLALSVSDASHIVLLGRAMDFGRCRSMRKDGRACLAPINVLHGSYCDFHSSSKMRKIGSRRPALQGDGSRGALLKMMSRPNVRGAAGVKAKARATRGIVGVSTRQHRDLSGNATYSFGAGKKKQRVAIGGATAASRRSSIAKGMVWRQGAGGRMTTSAAAGASARLGAKRVMSKGERMLAKALGATQALARKTVVPRKHAAVPAYRTSAIAAARADRAFGAPRSERVGGAPAPKRRKVAAAAAAPKRDRLSVLLGGNGVKPKAAAKLAAARKKPFASKQARVRATMQSSASASKSSSCAAPRPPPAPSAPSSAGESREMLLRQERARMKRTAYEARQEAGHQEAINPAARAEEMRAKQAAAAAFLKRKATNEALLAPTSKSGKEGARKSPLRPMSCHFKNPLGGKRSFAASFGCGAVPKAGSDAGRKLVNAKSINARALEVDKDERLTRLIGARAKRERVAERLEELMEIKVKVYSCLEVRQFAAFYFPLPASFLPHTLTQPLSLARVRSLS